MVSRSSFDEKFIYLNKNTEEIRKVLCFLNSRTKEINNSFKNDSRFSQKIFKIFPQEPLVLYRGEGIQTFPFLFIDMPEDDIYVENRFIKGGIFGTVIFSKSFFFEASSFEEDIQNLFISTDKDKYGFLILKWKSGDSQIRTDRKYRKDFYSVEAYHNGKCLFLNIIPEEGLIDFSYSGVEEWGFRTNISVDMLINFLLERINA